MSAPLTSNQSPTTAHQPVRRRGVQVFVGSYLLVIGLLGMLGTVAGAGYAGISGQVSSGEAVTSAVILLPVLLLGILAPACVVLARRGAVASVLTGWLGLLVPLLPLAYLWSGSESFSPLFLLGLLLALPPIVATLVWLFSRQTAAVPESASVPGPRPRRVPEGAYVVVALGNEYGPYSAAQLAELVRDGHVTWDSVLRFDGGAPFSARELPDLFR